MENCLVFSIPPPSIQCVAPSGCLVWFCWTDLNPALSPPGICTLSGVTLALPAALSAPLNMNTTEQPCLSYSSWSQILLFSGSFVKNAFLGSVYVTDLLSGVFLGIIYPVPSQGSIVSRWLHLQRNPCSGLSLQLPYDSKVCAPHTAHLSKVLCPKR